MPATPRGVVRRIPIRLQGLALSKVVLADVRSRIHRSLVGKPLCYEPSGATNVVEIRRKALSFTARIDSGEAESGTHVCRVSAVGSKVGN